MDTQNTRSPERTEAESAPTASVTEVGEASLVEEELLVEEVSIDGMCGVY
ncbi:MAG: mycofactocin precursor MftA [Microthrixaceae bacterium]|nr:mycofactocin precursor MftA [Microthrixaceae bacterium]